MMMRTTPFEPSQHASDGAPPKRCHGWHGNTWRSIVARKRYPAGVKGAGRWLTRAPWRRLAPRVCPPQLPSCDYLIVRGDATRSQRQRLALLPCPQEMPLSWRAPSSKSPTPARTVSISTYANMAIGGTQHVKGVQPGHMGTSHHIARRALPEDIMDRSVPGARGALGPGLLGLPSDGACPKLPRGVSST